MKVYIRHLINGGSSMLAKKFINVLSLLDVLETVEKTHEFHIDIHGYEKHTHYSDFRLHWTETITLPHLLFIDEVEFAPFYGFLIAEYEDRGERHLVTEQNNTRLTLESIKMEPFSDEIDYHFTIYGEPKDISMMADSEIFVVDLNITGCLQTAPFWKQSLYLSYLLYKGDNILSSFMHLFITFEGLIRYHTNDTTTPSIHRVYKNYTDERMSDYLNAYRNIRNQVMHGNENIASKLTHKDLDILIDTIEQLEVNKTSISVRKNTEAIDEGLRLT